MGSGLLVPYAGRSAGWSGAAGAAGAWIATNDPQWSQMTVVAPAGLRSGAPQLGQFKLSVDMRQDYTSVDQISGRQGDFRFE